MTEDMSNELWDLPVGRSKTVPAKMFWDGEWHEIGTAEVKNDGSHLVASITLHQDGSPPPITTPPLQVSIGPIRNVPVDLDDVDFFRTRDGYGGSVSFPPSQTDKDSYPL